MTGTKEETTMGEGFAAVGLHRPSRPENIGGVLRAADVYGVELVVLGGGTLPPDALGHPTDTTQAWRRIPVVFAADVLDALPEACVCSISRTSPSRSPARPSSSGASPTAIAGSFAIRAIASSKSPT